MSLKKLANLSKERRLIAQNVTKKVALDSPLIEENKSGKTLTTRENRLHTKGSQGQKEVLKQNMNKANCIARGAKPQFGIVDDDEEHDDHDEADEDSDEDDDGDDDIEKEDDVIVQDDVGQDDEYEEHGDDGDDDFENEDDVLVQEQLQRPELEKATGTVFYSSLMFFN
jgi:hypothetical protein